MALQNPTAMKFKFILTAIACSFILSSCKNRDSGDKNSETGSAVEKSRSEGSTNSGNNDNEDTKTKSSTMTDSEGSAATIEAQYIKVGEESDFNCGCYCLNLNFTSNSELCLSPDNIYI